MPTTTSSPNATTRGSKDRRSGRGKTPIGPGEDAKKAGTAYEQIRDRLYQDILAGHFPPGSRLTIAPLCTRYGTSPTPIRQALQELHGQGFVTMLPHQGARVRLIDADYIRNIYGLRGAIIGLLVPKCVRFVSNAEIERLETIQSALEAAIAGKRVTQIIRANQQFHAAVYGIARDPVAFDVMEKTWLPLDGLRSALGFSGGRLADMAACHRALIHALRDRKAALATRILRQANDAAMDDMLLRLTDGSEQRGRKPAPWASVRTGQGTPVRKANGRLP